MSDFSDILRITAELESARDELGRMADQVAKAKQIREWDSERRRAALSREVAPLLVSMGVSAAEHSARASESYVNAMRLLQRDLYEAEQMLAKYEAVKCRWESARTMASLQKAIAGNL